MAMWPVHYREVSGRVDLAYPAVGDVAACLFDQNLCAVVIGWTAPERYASGDRATAAAYAELLAEDPSGAEDGDDT